MSVRDTTLYTPAPRKGKGRCRRLLNARSSCAAQPAPLFSRVFRRRPGFLLGGGRAALLATRPRRRRAPPASTLRSSCPFMFAQAATLTLRFAAAFFRHIELLAVRRRGAVPAAAPPRRARAACRARLCQIKEELRAAWQHRHLLPPSLLLSPRCFFTPPSAPPSSRTAPSRTTPRRTPAGRPPPPRRPRISRAGRARPPRSPPRRPWPCRPAS